MEIHIKKQQTPEVMIYLFLKHVLPNEPWNGELQWLESRVHYEKYDMIETKV